GHGVLADVAAVLRGLDRSLDRVSLAQAVLLDQAHRDVDVGRAGQVAGGADERVVVQQVQDAADGHEHVLVGVRLLVLLARSALTPTRRAGTGALAVAVAVAVAVAATTTAPVVVTVVVEVTLLALALALAIPLALPVAVVTLALPVAVLALA